MQSEKSPRFNYLVPWLFLLLLLGGLSLFGLQYRPNTVFEDLSRRKSLVSGMRIHLLKSIEAEKNAILTATDAEAKGFIEQARQATAELQSSRKQIEPLVSGAGQEKERQLLGDFDSCWSQYQALAETLLGIAGQNTNLKARQLSFHQATDQLEQFEKSLMGLIQSQADPARQEPIARLAYKALVEALKILQLQAPHIEASLDEVMDRLEQRIQASDASVRESLGQLTLLTGSGGGEQLDSAKRDYEAFLATTKEILALSRQNTNVKSVELSLGKKQLISLQCQKTLTELQDSIESMEFKATK